MPSPVGEIVLAAEDLKVIEQRFLNEDVETCAVLIGQQVVQTNGTRRILVRDVIFPEPSEYSKRGKLEAELRPNFVAQVTKRARTESATIIFAHSHPGKEQPEFSSIDDFGEARLAKFLAIRVPENTHAALVLSEGGLRARQLGEKKLLRVISLGSERTVVFEPSALKRKSSLVYDRQVRAFGAPGQAKIEKLHVAIVGLGGTGSIVAQELAHLGVRRFTLIDADVLENTNLNRVVNSTAKDIGKPKVTIAKRTITKLVKDAEVSAIRGDVVWAGVARKLLDADLIFCCTDSHGSRSVIQQVSYQYFIPCIDIGTIITVEKSDQIKSIFGRTQLLAPGLACLTCSGLLNAAEVRRDMMNEFERKQDPYIQGAHEPAPAVISLNATISSLAVTMFLSVVAHIPIKGRYLLYNAVESTIRTVRGEPEKSCYICSRAGAFARGNSWPLLARQD
jgi:molybdopterin/thiamine biosynthesis adenylyltransferase